MPDALLSGSFPNDSTQSDQARWEENMHVCKQAPTLKFKKYEEQQKNALRRQYLRRILLAAEDGARWWPRFLLLHPLLKATM